MARLFKGDAYAVILTKTERIELSQINNERRLDITFNIAKTNDSKPNHGECTIFNLSENTRNKLISEGVQVEIYAGYDDLKLIGSGSIENVNNVKNGPDWQTKISFGDGQKSYQQSRFSKSYGAGNDIKNIVDDVAKSLVLSVKNEAKNLAGKIETGLTLDGLSKDILDELSLQNDISWSIVNDVLQIINGPLISESIVVSSNTGLLSHPVLTERGVDVKIQLNADVGPNRLITIEDAVSAVVSEKLKDQRNKSANGNYICDTVQFIGDNFGGGFDVNISASRYG